MSAGQFQENVELEEHKNRYSQSSYQSPEHAQRMTKKELKDEIVKEVMEQFKDLRITELPA